MSHSPPKPSDEWYDALLWLKENTPDETMANAIMDKRMARYIVVDRRMGLNKFVQGNRFMIKGTL